MATDDKGRVLADVAEPVIEGAPAGLPTLPDRYADESYKLFSQVHVAEPTPEEALKIRNKCLWRILPFLCIGYHLMYLDKQTVCNRTCSIRRQARD